MLDCKVVRAGFRGFINGFLSAETEEAIIIHLAKCNDCKKFYKDYCEAIGKKFDIKDIINKFHSKCIKQKYKSELIPVLIERGLIKQEELKKMKTYLELAKEKDVVTLSNVVSVNELLKSSIEYDEKDEHLVSDFGWYLVEQSCARVDMLERSLAIDSERVE